MKMILILFICLAAGALKAQSATSDRRAIRMVSSRRYTRFYMGNDLLLTKDARQYLDLFPNSANELRRSDICAKSSLYNAGIYTLSYLTAGITYKRWYNNPTLHQLDQALLITAGSSYVGWLVSSSFYKIHLRRAVNLYNKNLMLARAVAGP
jgi:hypothetical protein